jgi:hypothetical protein
VQVSVLVSVQEKDTDMPRNWLAFSGQCRKCRIFQALSSSVAVDGFENGGQGS